MTCSIYCLVSAGKSLDVLVARLAEAGVATRDIMVVTREAPVPAEAGAAAPARAAQQQWWPVPVPAWWWLPLYAWTVTLPPGAPPRAGERPGAEGARAHEVEVIPLARYRAAQGGRR